jgi:small-conductance mechanosensitive channel
MPFEILRNAVLDWTGPIPDGMVTALLALIVIVVCVAVALVVQSLLARLVRRALGVRRPLLTSILAQMRGPLRFAFVLLALNIAAAFVPMAEPVGSGIGRALQVAFIAFLGWMALAAVNIAAVVYVRRFNIQTADNLLARKHVTQVRILKGAVNTLIVVIAVAAALMTFEQVRQFGVSLFASAGIAGIVVGLAARPMLSNMIAGLQLAITQPIRIEDAIVIEGEFGNVEEIGSTYVVVRLWDQRRMIVPLSNFIEKPFQNWTREGAQIIGSVMLYVDYNVPVGRVREKATEIVKRSKLWDGAVVGLQVTDCKDDCIELRVLASASTSGAAWDLRCEVREQLVEFLQREYPQSLPRRRQQIVDGSDRTEHPHPGGEVARKPALQRN